jgi:PIN domain nuclease of toxin-antitoxin system
MGRKRQPRLTFLDTHIVCWLYEGRLDLISPPAQAEMESGLLRISPTALLEVHYLHEIGRITKTANQIYAALSQEIGLRTGDANFAEVAAKAQTLNWTRDPFDRLIVAEALVSDGVLVTRDEKIREHCSSTVW